MWEAINWRRFFFSFFFLGGAVALFGFFGDFDFFFFRILLQASPWDHSPPFPTKKSAPFFPPVFPIHANSRLFLPEFLAAFFFPPLPPLTKKVSGTTLFSLEAFFPYSFLVPGECREAFLIFLGRGTPFFFFFGRFLARKSGFCGGGFFFPFWRPFFWGGDSHGGFFFSFLVEIASFGGSIMPSLVSFAVFFFFFPGKRVFA